VEKELGREPTIAELRAHAHEAVDEALNWVETSGPRSELKRW
jgi:hypothetical protein